MLDARQRSFTLPGTPGCDFWLEANRGVTYPSVAAMRVSSWRTFGGVPGAFTQSLAIQRPTWVRNSIYNNRPYISMGIAGSARSLAATLASQPVYWLAVMVAPFEPDIGTVLYRGTAGGISSNIWRVEAFEGNWSAARQAGLTMYADGKATEKINQGIGIYEAIDTSPVAWTTPWTILGGADWFEFGQFSILPTSDQRRHMLHYLSTKYNIPLQDNP